jgi:hypothetical protein
LFQDNVGSSIANICWVAPIKTTNEFKTFVSKDNVVQFATQYVLLLPTFQKNGLLFNNLCDTIGSSWTERVKAGQFVKHDFNIKVFVD